MAADGHTLTRRQLLRSAGLVTAGLAVGGVLDRTVAKSLLSSPSPPYTPRWITRPDLRIPALTVLRSERGVSSDPIFIAPYNAPGGQAGAVIADNDGEPIWENPLAGKVTTNFRVQRYRGEPVLTWWEGYIELGRGRRIRDLRRRLPHRPSRAGLARIARRPARVRDHATRHRAADELRRQEG